MASKRSLVIAVSDTRHHIRVLDGSFAIEGYEITPVPLAPGEMYSRVFEQADIDVGEISIARYVSMHSEGTSKFLAIPYYFLRVFPHATFYARADLPASDPSEIAGCIVGLSEYDHTGHTWSRALLEDEYGVRPADVRWIVARRESSRPPIRHFFQPPPDVTLSNARPEKFLSQMLLDGEIDVMINPHAPSCFVEHPDRVRRLVPDHKQAERDYFARTGLCPIQHVLGIRKELLADDPELAQKLEAAFVSAVGESRAIWDPEEPGDEVPEVRLHGLAENEQASLTTFLRHHHSQGMSARQMTLGEFFASGI